MTSKFLCVAVILAAQMPAASVAQTPAPSPIFTFETDEFWLNLHHYLYVLGRSHAKLVDASQPAVAGAPPEAQRGLRGLTEEEQKTWNEAVGAYATGLSLKNPIFDAPLPEMAGALARAEDAATLSNAAIDPAAVSVLEQAAPIYRKAWWPAHRASNQRLRALLQTQVDRYGQGVLDFITRAYGMTWPSVGFPVHLVAYATRQGSYSTTGNLLVLSTNPNPGNQGLLALEIAFHEGMHQWDDEVQHALLEGASKIGRSIRANIVSHAMIWMTASEAVRRVAPEHIAYAEVFGLWNSEFGPFRAPLQETWKPYLDGRGTRDEALAALTARTAFEPRR